MGATSTPAWSEHTLRSLATFGLTTRDARSDDARRAHRIGAHADALRAALRPGDVAVLIGPSGSGKSSILAELRGPLQPAQPLLPPARPDNSRTVIDALRTPPHDTPVVLRALSAAGLADAFIPARPVALLSTGERARLAIARALLTSDATSPHNNPLLILDDFGDAIDDPAMLAIVPALRRWLAAHPRARIVAATLREAARAALAPTLTLRLAHDSSATLDRSAPAPPEPASDFLIRRGAPRHYHALAHHHYRAGPPATIAQVLVAHRRERPDHPIGVLTVSMPTLNGAWRQLAWPYQPSHHLAALGHVAPNACARPTPSARAHFLNQTLRCISRVIIAPDHRARGVAAALVRAYLAAPLTPRTEAVSAMGASSPLFTAAGMVPWTLAPARRDLTLIDALSAADLRPWMLADVDHALAALDRFPHLDRALRVWANAHGHTRRLTTAPPEDLIRAAARSIAAPRHAYTHGH